MAGGALGRSVERPDAQRLPGSPRSPPSPAGSGCWLVLGQRQCEQSWLEPRFWRGTAGNPMGTPRRPAPAHGPPPQVLCVSLKTLLLGTPSSPDRGRPPAGSLPRVQGPLCREPRHLWAPTSPAAVSLGCWGRRSWWGVVLIGLPRSQRLGLPPAQIRGQMGLPCPML